LFWYAFFCFFNILLTQYLFYGQAERGIMKWMRLKIVTGVKSFSKPEQPQPKKSKFLSAAASGLVPRVRSNRLLGGACPHFPFFFAIASK
jgi:hypothetical protein